ncbi:MAG: HNH endonuclease family protein, partial [Burkholderiaceae bacterium]
ELRAIAEASDPEKQKVQLNAFVADRFEKNMAGKSQELADALKRFTLHSMQQYRTRYLLARLTQHVDMAFSGVEVPGSLEPFTKLEIEHILPDSPKAELRATWAAENPNAVYDDYKNRLGNLTLLEKPINIVAGNDFYTAKQVEYSKSGNYLTRSLVALTPVGQNTSISRINAKLEAFPAWNAASIEKRHAMLIALAQDVWKTTAIDV